MLLVNPVLPFFSWAQINEGCLGSRDEQSLLMQLGPRRAVELQPLGPARYWLDRRSPGSGWRGCISEAGVLGAAGELWLDQTTGALCKSSSSKGLGRARQLAFEGHGKFPPPFLSFHHSIQPSFPPPPFFITHTPNTSEEFIQLNLSRLQLAPEWKVSGVQEGEKDASWSWSLWLPLTLCFLSLRPPPHLARTPHFLSTYLL